MASSQKATFTPEQKSTLEVVARFKGGELLKRDKTLYFLPASRLSANVYDISLLDFLLDWGNTQLQLTAEQLAVARAAGIGQSTLLRCEFKNGKVNSYCELRLSTSPPPAEWFENKQPKWYYVNEVVKMEASPQAIPKSVLDEITRVEKHNNIILEQIYRLKGNLLENPKYDEIRSKIQVPMVQDKNGVLFKFSQMATYVPEYVDARSFSVVKEPTLKQIEVAQDLAPIDHNERSPVKTSYRAVYIVADAEE